MLAPSGLFIGRATLDFINLVDRFPAADEKITARMQLVLAGGPALNAAITFAHLGGEATLVSSFGERPFARAAKAECIAHGVTVIDRAEGLDYDFPVSVVVSAREGASRCVINGPAVGAGIRAETEIDGPVDPHIVLLDQFEIEAATALATRHRAAGVPIVLDGGSWKPTTPAFLALATIPIVSSRFLPPPAAGHEDTMALLGALFGAWAVTQGQRGVVFGDGCEIGRLEAIPVEAQDTLGAGDIFHGAFCHAFASKRSYVEALRFAAEIAAQSCRWAGTRAWMTAARQRRRAPDSPSAAAKSVH